MNKYQNMVIQRSLKQELKIKSFYFIDLIALIAPTLLLIQMQDVLKLPLHTLVLLSILCICLALFLCAKPASNGNHRNIYTIYCLLKMDRRVYAVQSLDREEFKHGQSKQDNY